MKRTSGILGIAAGTAVLAAVLWYKRRAVTKLMDGCIGRLLNNIHGPYGEPVYLDMYERQFYENSDGCRVYMDNA